MSTSSDIRPSPTEALPVLPMPLSEFPNPQLYSECRDMAGIMSLGAHVLETSTYYYACRLGKAYPLWRTYLGDCYFHAVMASLTPELERTMTAIEAPKAHGSDLAVPDIVLLVAHALAVALKHRTGELLHSLNQALEEYLSLDVEAVPSMEEITILLQPFVRLVKATQQDTPHKAQQLRAWRKNCWAIVASYSVPVKAISELQNDPIAPVSLPNTSPSPNMITHLDGSLGVDARPHMSGWFAPRRAILATSGEQINDTLKLHPKPYADPLALWWRIHNDGRHPEVYMHTAARVLDAVGRTLAQLFKHDQMAILNGLIPTDIVVGAIVDFVVAYSENPPSLSIPQLRCSFLSAAIATIAAEGEIAQAVHSVCEKAHLHDSEKLLIATMELHEERLVLVYPPLAPHRTKH